MIAVEADGPAHFTTNKPYRRLGSTVLRDRFLATRGYSRLLCMPFYEWGVCENPQQQADMMKGFLTCGRHSYRWTPKGPNGHCIPEVSSAPYNCPGSGNG